MSMNNCTFIGRICNEIEVKTSSGGKSFARFNIAVSRSYVKEGSERESDFIPISVFGKTADFVGKYFKKGQEIAIIGELHSSSFTDKEGNKRTGYEIAASQVSFTGTKKDNGGGGSAPAKGNSAPAAAPASDDPGPTPPDDFDFNDPEFEDFNFD